MKLDILAIGVHPDDVELSCSGTILASIAQGKKVGIVDLTQGELGTRGSAETRKIEADNAAKILGVHARENLKMADGFFIHDENNVKKVIYAIRKYQPQIILCNAPNDRHPDHGRASKMVMDACFLSGLRKIETHNKDGSLQEKHRPSYAFQYIQDKYIIPNFLFDISKFMDKKLESILAYTTQFFDTNSQEPKTYISSPKFLETVKARDMIHGKRIGVEYAEGFLTEKILGIESFDAFVCNET